PPARRPQRAVDSATAASTAPAADTSHAVAAPSPAAHTTRSAPAPTAMRAETTLVTTNRVMYDIVSPGGVPARVRLPEYRALTRGGARDAHVDLLPPGDRLFALRVVSGRDTIALDTVAFSSSGTRRERSDDV